MLEPHDVELLRRHAEVQAGLGDWGVAHRARMAHRAIQEGLRDALVEPLGHADRQVLALLVEQAERCEAGPGRCSAQTSGIAWKIQ